MSSTQQLLLGEGAGGGIPNYIEEVFSTYLYTGTGATQTITNNIDLSTKGGLLWIKNRTAANNNILFDTSRGANNYLYSNLTNASAFSALYDQSFTTSGFGIGSSFAEVNATSNNYVSWTFREQPKFFDIVTWTGNSTPRQIAHNLGSAPGCIITKRVDSTSQWAVWHRSGTQTNGKFCAFLNTDGTYSDQASNYWGSETNPPDMNATTFGVGTDGAVNSSGFTYIAYLFAHDAGGFGLTGSDNVISCGGYTGNNTSQSITLGYEPQWILAKPSSAAGDWFLFDNMRGIATGGSEATLKTNDSAAESNAVNALSLNATGFDLPSASFNNSGVTYIYIAIRRGPMKVPTSGTSVFVPVLSSTTPTVLTSNFPVDMALSGTRTPGAYEKGINDRLRGFSNTSSGTSPWIVTNASVSESANTGTPSYYSAGNTSITIGDYFSGATLSNYLFGRAPSFFDEVCYTGTGSATTFSHNLGVVPELIIVKRRSAAAAWFVYSSPLGNENFLELNNNSSVASASSAWNNTTPTSSVFTVGTATQVNASGSTYVTYLFATCAGVSKVGSYTGTGTTLQINCGFTAGSRFVLIKRTDSTGDWYVWDSARGIIAGNDPYLLLNSTAAEVTGTDYVDTYSAGFEITSTAPSAINASGGTYIFLAIA